MAFTREQQRNYKSWSRFPLKQLYPDDRSLEKTLKKALDRVDQTWRCLVAKRTNAKLSIELYACPPKNEIPGKDGAATLMDNSALHGFFHPVDILRCTTADAFSLWGHVNSEPPTPQFQEIEDGPYSTLWFDHDESPEWSFTLNMKE